MNSVVCRDVVPAGRLSAISLRSQRQHPCTRHDPEVELSIHLLVRVSSVGYSSRDGHPDAGGDQAVPAVLFLHVPLDEGHGLFRMLGLGEDDLRAAGADGDLVDHLRQTGDAIVQAASSRAVARQVPTFHAQAVAMATVPVSRERCMPRCPQRPALPKAVQFSTRVRSATFWMDSMTLGH